MIGRCKAGAVALAMASLALLAGCSAVEETGQDSPSTKPSPSAAPFPEIVLTSSDLSACSAEPTKTRIIEALSESTIAPSNSPLALPQEMSTYAKATAQMNAWRALAEPDRLFQICLNYQQGNFGSHTPTP